MWIKLNRHKICWVRLRVTQRIVYVGDCVAVNRV